MAEVTNFGIVPHNNFKQLIALKTCLEMNFARLSSCDLQGEMNNTSCMKIIQTKFPSAQQLKWTEHLEGLSEDIPGLFAKKILETVDGQLYPKISSLYEEEKKNFDLSFLKMAFPRNRVQYMKKEFRFELL